MNIAFSSTVAPGPYGLNAMRTKSAEMSQLASVMPGSQERRNGSFGTGRASSSMFYSQEKFPLMTWEPGAQVRSILVKVSFLSRDGISGGMALKLQRLKKKRRGRVILGSVSSWRRKRRT